MTQALIEQATSTIADLMRKNHPIAIASSFGKDSCAITIMALAAALRVKEEGIDPLILVHHGDTLVENPANRNYTASEMLKLQLWAKKNKINLTCHVASPSLAAGFAVRVIGGRALPSFPGTNTDCSQSYKIDPARKLRKSILKALNKTGIEAVTLVGTRYDESEARARRMEKRGDSSTEPVRNKEGELVLSPIAEWLTDEVWEVLALASNGDIPTYSDFQETFQLYADAGGTSCAVVSDAILSSKPKVGCGARQGCHVCVAVSSDTSMENMIQESGYAFMKPLNDIRNFMANTRWDMSRRLWIGRTINNGYIRIAPDVYSPKMMRDLLRYYITADYDERVRARAAGEEPRFEVLPLTTIVAIDAVWSLQGYNKPHSALVDWIEITQVLQGHSKRYYPPKVPVSIRPPAMPKPMYYYVGDEWDEGLGAESGGVGLLNGLRDPVLELVSGGDNFGGCMGTRLLSNGNLVMDVEGNDYFDVDLDGALDAMMFFEDEIMERYNNSDGKTGLTSAYRFWLGMGTVALSPQQVAIHDKILRRTAFKERHGLAGPDVDLQSILSKCVSQNDMKQPIVEIDAENEDEDYFIRAVMAA